MPSIAMRLLKSDETTSASANTWGVATEDRREGKKSARQRRDLINGFEASYLHRVTNEKAGTGTRIVSNDPWSVAI
jgi:hypothetical protein